MRYLRTLVCLLAVGPALTAVSWAAPVADKVTEGWYLGLPVVLEVQIPRSGGGHGPDKPAGGRVQPVYLIAPVDESVAFTPDLIIQTPAGKRLLPAHQDVLSACPANAPGSDSKGFFVLMGARGSPETVRVRALANEIGSVPGGSLAMMLRVGKSWIPLTSHAVIEYGVANGRLRLVPFMFGGRIRARGRDGPLAACIYNRQEQL